MIRDKQAMRARMDRRMDTPVHVETRPPAQDGTLNTGTGLLELPDPSPLFDALVMVSNTLQPSETDEAGVLQSERRVRIRFPVGLVVPVGAFVVVLDELEVDDVTYTADPDQVGDEYRVVGLDESSNRISNKILAEWYGHRT